MPLNEKRENSTRRMTHPKMLPRMNVMAEGPLETKQLYKLLQWVRLKNKAQVEKMVLLGVPCLINLTEPKEGIGALHLVSVANDLDMARFLLSLNAHPDVQDKKGRTAMMLAAELGHVSMMQLLASNQARVTLVDKEGKGLLFYCIGPTKMHTQILEMAVNLHADVNNISYAGKSVFLFACENAKDYEHLCMRLLESGADPNVAHPVMGCTPLMAAVKAGSVALVRAILQRGGNPNAVDRIRLHAAYIAAAKGFFKVLRMLSAYSADFSLTTVLGNTALHAAAAEGQTQCCRFLFQRGCNVMARNRQDLIPSQIAKKNGHKATLKELKDAENALISGSLPSVSEARLHDWSFEHEAVLRKAFQLAEGADSPVETISVETFVSVLQVHYAPIDDDSLKSVVNMLNMNYGKIAINDFFMGYSFLPEKYALSSYERIRLTAGKTDKTEAKKDECPLPIYTNPPDMMQEIDKIPQSMSISTDRLRVDPTEDPFLSLDEPKEIYININQCVRTNDFELMSLAFSQHVPVDIRDRFYKTPLMIACNRGNYQMAHFLISHGANVNMYDQFKWTCLHHACFGGHANIVKLLLEHGAVVDATTSNGVTPLMKAIQNCKFSCVDLLIKSGANVEATDKRGQNCLLLAQMYATKQICDLVDIGTQSSAMQDQGKKPTLKQKRPAAKEDVRERAGQRKCIISLNLQSKDHCITLPSITVLGKKIDLSPRLKQMQTGRKNRFTNVDKLVIDPIKDHSAGPATVGAKKQKK